jgi:hypothetical protein
MAAVTYEPHHMVEAGRHLARPAEAGVWRATGREEPVFLDRSGRRSPAVRVVGGIAAVASATWLAALVTGAIGFANLPAPPAIGVSAVAARAPRRFDLVAQDSRGGRVLALDHDDRLVARHHRLDIRTS